MPLNPHGKPCGVPHTTKVPEEILEILQNNTDVTRQDIRRLMHYRYCPRTLQKHLGELRKDGVVECYCNGNMRKPRYRRVTKS
jgi:predicted HTH transcriptional regulator